MAVRSQPIRRGKLLEELSATATHRAPAHGAAAHKPFSAERIRAGNRRTRQIAAKVILAASFLGSVLAFNGGTTAIRLTEVELSWMDPRLFGLNIYLMVAGLAVQFIVTRIEWENMRNKWSLWYLGALIVDVGTTYAAYGAVLTWLAGLALGPFQLDQTTTQVLSTGLAVLIAVGGAYLPEHELVEN